MELMEISDKRKMGREEAAEVLHKLADSLARHNEVEFSRNGITFHVDVPREVTLEVELELETDGSSIEIEISW